MAKSPHDRFAKQRSFKRNPPQPVEWNRIGAIAALIAFLLLSPAVTVGLVLSPLLAWMHPVLAVAAALLMVLSLIGFGGGLIGTVMVFQEYQSGRIDAAHRMFVRPPSESGHDPSPVTDAEPPPAPSPVDVRPDDTSLLPGEVDVGSTGAK